MNRKQMKSIIEEMTLDEKISQLIQLATKNLSFQREKFHLPNGVYLDLLK